MTMNDATKMAVARARKGASDDVIALVMEAMTPHPPAPTTPPAPEVTQPTRPDTKASSGRSGRVQLYMPLLAAIRQRVAATGPLETAVRALCDQHRAEWMQSREGLTSNENARGFAAIISHAVKHTGGIVGGLRFTFVKLLRGRGVRGGGGVCFYRVELA